jgi:hypothetical protein
MSISAPSAADAGLIGGSRSPLLAALTSNLVFGAKFSKRVIRIKVPSLLSCDT